MTTNITLNTDTSNKVVSVVVDGVTFTIPAVAVPPTPTPTPPTTSTYPKTWTDFTNTFGADVGAQHPTAPNQLINGVSIVDNSGNPVVSPDQNGYSGFIVKNSRMRGREGPRAAGAPITVDHSYIEIHAEVGDHADCIQAYQGSGITLTNSKLLAGGPGATCIFAADNSIGTILLDGNYFGALPGYSTPGYLVRINYDGAKNIIVRNCVFEKSAPNAFTSSLITEWTNNKYTDGTVYNKP